MAGGFFKKSSGIAALVAGLALALPATASAQDRGQRGDRGGSEVRGDSNRGFRALQQGGAGTQTKAERMSRAQSDTRGATRSERRQDNAQRPTWRGNDGDANRQRGDDRRWDRNRDQARGDDDRRRWGNDRDRARGDNDGRRWDGNRWSGNDNNRRWNNDNRRWDNNWRRDNRYNWQSYRSSNRNVYRAGRYYTPYRNYNYRRLSIGFSLQPLFYSSSYWINDPWQYRLPEAYGPYRWVRYYDDALLVDIYTGRVVDVINDFFW